VTSKVHVYSLPRDAVSTAAGYAAASWTADPRNHIFTARLRVLETSFPVPSPIAQQSTPPQEKDEEEQTELKVDILLEDPSTGALFAAAAYTAPATVEPTTDSSRFFAVRVQDPSGKQKATLGIGFEERSEAFDFGVALQEARRALNWESHGQAPKGVADGGRIQFGTGKGGLGVGGEEGEKRDLSLKEGETITVNLSGTRFGRRAARSGEGSSNRQEGEAGGGQSLKAFALPPPPPPSSSSRAQKRLSAQQLGFDDGQFGEFA
jgi:hypothetical protein